MGERVGLRLVDRGFGSPWHGTPPYFILFLFFLFFFCCWLLTTSHMKNMPMPLPCPVTPINVAGAKR